MVYFWVVLSVILRLIGAHDGISLCFVIDLTSSMQEELQDVQIGTKMILNRFLKMGKESPLKDYVFVGFRDPDIEGPLVTNNELEFQRKLDSMKVYGGGDWDEMCLTGIIEAAKAVRNGSNLYVFTDASPKDHALYQNAVSILKDKGLKVNFVITGKYSVTSMPQYKIYNEIASETGGQVFNVGKSDVIEYMQTLLDSIGSYELDSNVTKTSGASENATIFHVKPEDSKLIIQVTIPDTSDEINGTLYNPRGSIETEADGLKVHFKKNSNIYSVSKDNPESGIWKLKLTSKSNSYVKTIKTVKSIKNETQASPLKRIVAVPAQSIGNNTIEAKFSRFLVFLMYFIAGIIKLA